MPPLSIKLYNKSDILGSLYFKVYLIVRVEVADIFMNIDSSKIWRIYREKKSVFFLQYLAV